MWYKEEEEEAASREGGCEVLVRGIVAIWEERVGGRLVSEGECWCGFMMVAVLKGSLGGGMFQDARVSYLAMRWPAKRTDGK